MDKLLKVSPEDREIKTNYLVTKRRLNEFKKKHKLHSISIDIFRQNFW